MKLIDRHSFKLKPVYAAVVLILAGISTESFAQAITAGHGTAVYERPNGTNEASAPAPGDVITYTLTIDASGGFLSGIDVSNPTPTNTTFVSGSTQVSNARNVFIYRDEFTLDGNPAAGAGSYGNQDWTSTPWAELGETNGWANGDTRMGNDANINQSGGDELGLFRFRDSNGSIVGINSEGGARIVDLQDGATNCVAATLSFDYANLQNNPMDAGEYLRVRDSVNGDDTVFGDWTELGTAPEGDGSGDGATFTPFSASMTPANLTSNTRVLVQTEGAANNGNEGWYIDDLQVTAICNQLTQFVSSDAPNLLSSTFYTGATYGLDTGETLTITIDVVVDEGTLNSTLLSNTVTGAFADLTSATTINGTSETLISDPDTDTSVTVILRDDMGDAPETLGYTTLIANGGPQHVVTAGVFLGDTLPDLDSGGFTDGTQGAGDASEDDAGGDEGIDQLITGTVTEFPAISVADTSYSLDIDLTNNVASAASLVAWIDFDGNGDFDEDELASANIAISAGAVSTTVTWTDIGGIGPDIIGGDTYARFRLTTDATLIAGSNGGEDEASIGFADDGEVEDYQITITTPVCYAAYSDASIDDTVFDLIGLSPVAIGGQGDFDVVTNNNDGDDDQYGMVLTTELVVPSTGNYSFRLDSDDGAQIYIDGLLVLDYDGAHGTGSPVTVSNVPLSAGNSELQIFYFENTGGNSLSVEWDASGSLTPIAGSDIAAPASCPTDPDFPLDYGDADAAYADAYHPPAFDDNYSLGSIAPDTETSQPSSVGADGDDTAGTDDEDADPDLSGLDNITTGNYVVSVPVANAGADATLGGWIDFDGDTLFETNEYASATVTSSDSSVDLTFDTDAADSVSAGTTYARFRITRDSITNADANGALSGGEVEDYSLTIVDAAEVFFEAECGIAGNVWTATYDAAVSQSTYIQTTINTTNDPTGAQPDVDLMRYDIIVPLAGTYNLYSLVNFNGGGNNSFYVGLDNNTWIEWNALNTGGAWQWGDTTQNITTTGSNESVTIYVHYREDGSLIDKFAVTNTLPTGLGTDVGSCFDFGDDSTHTSNLATGGPYHAVDGASTIYLGNVAPDTEADALANATATGDDSADEGAAQLLSTTQGTTFPELTPVDTSYSFEIDLFNDVDSVNSTNASLFAWIDFNMDGVFDETELADSAPFTVANGAANQTQTLSWTGLSGLTLGTTTARFRISTDTELIAGSDAGEDEASLGVAIDGEVEDHQISITADDYGDAPASYGDAVHAISGTQNLYLGPATPDDETSTQLGGDAGVGADGDDGDGNDDESSVGSIPVISTGDIGQTYSLSVTVVNAASDANADLFGWIDFDGNTVFDTDEAVSINTPTTGVYQLDWTVPGDISLGATYIRLRLTSDPSVTTATPNGAASDGEVEDYSATVSEPVDYGDAIDSGLGTGIFNYRTELADDGARHGLSANLFLGDIVADAEPDAADNGSATGDELDNTADEGIEQLLIAAEGSEFSEITVADTSFSFNVDLTTDAAAYLYVWVDYDQNGSFDEDEIAGAAPIVIGLSDTQALVTSVPTSDAIVGNTFMRLRLTTDLLAPGAAGGEDERSYGIASDGEVEDYRITLVGLDFGDAPDTYGTDKTDSGGEGIGPSHIQSGTLYIGDALPDLDSDGVPDANASGDDIDGDDEGGFFIPVIALTDTSYSISLPLVNNSGASATLFGWLDYNDNGIFETGEGVSTPVASGATSATLTGWTFATMSAGETYLRLRLTTDGSISTATPGGSASDGEVEDHLVVVGSLDFGDAPDTYSTNITIGDDGVGGFDEVGPSHGISSALYIDDLPDGEADGTPSVAADGDGVDEDTFASFPLLTPSNDSFTLTVPVTNSTGGDAELVGWIDFDGNGFFDTDEAATVTLSNLVTSIDLVWDNIPGDISVGDTFIRLRLTSDSSIATGDATTSTPKGPATNGEVEDHAISIAIAYDYGDAPDTYGTDSTDGGEGFGARHIISPLLYLGSFAPDAEIDGQPSADALLDDDTGTGESTPLDSTDGDEGDIFIATIQPDQTSYSLSLPLTNATGSNATLYGWLDLNQDGDFEDTAESQSTTILPGSSFGTLTFTWVSGDTSGGDGLDNGSTFLRLRLSSETGLGPTETLVTDYADDGEVEDYRVQVSQLTCDLLYGMYNTGGYTRLREFDNDTVDLVTTSFQSAGIGIERNYRRFYYMEWPTATNRRLFYFDPTSAPSEVDTGASIATSGNYNRMSFAYGGRGVVVESSSFDVYMFDPTVAGTGQTITNAIGMSNAGSILGGGGDIAFDRDDNLYMLTYDTGINEFYLYELRFALIAGGASVEIPDMVLTGSPETVYEATAVLLLTESNPTGAQIGGMAFNFDNLIYLQGSGANTTFTWDVGITATGGTGAIQGPTDDEASSDLASCIYPYIRAIIEPVKTVVNTTSGSTGYVPGDMLEYSIVVRNSGGFPSFDSTFQDDIQSGTTYVPNSTYMNGEPLTDLGGLMPFVVGREIHTDLAVNGSGLGIVMADITPGVVGDNEVVITYSVMVDIAGGSGSVCNQGFVDYEANLVGAIPTDDPGTGAADDATCMSQTSGFQVNGTLFEDYNVDGIQSGSEPGIEGVSMVLYDSIALTCETVLTDANGLYEFPSVDVGPKTIYELSGNSVSAAAACSAPSALGNDPSGFLSSTINSSSIYVINADIAGIDFGDVRLPSLNPNLEGVIAPGATQTYSHLFRAPTNGDVSFATLSSDSPPLAGWSSLVYRDLDCSGELSFGDYPIISSTNLVAGESICLLNRVFAPSSATSGNSLLSDLTATFNYAGALVSDQDIEANDLTTVLDVGESALQLTKRVRNITDTSSQFDVVAGISNAANPGDRLRYEISFANTGVGNISDVDIYDQIPAFTELAEVLDASCTYTGPAAAPLSAIVPPTIMTSCSLEIPAGGNNVVGYDGSLHWQLLGTLQPGESGLIVFTVDVE